MDPVAAPKQKRGRLHGIAVGFTARLSGQPAGILREGRTARALQGLEDLGGVGFASEVTVGGEGDIGQPTIKSLGRRLAPIELSRSSGFANPLAQLVGWPQISSIENSRDFSASPASPYKILIQRRFHDLTAIPTSRQRILFV